jgi:hypothetical protein
MNEHLYTTVALQRVIERIGIPHPGFLDTFFQDTIQSEDEEIAFDVMPEGRRVSPFVSPLLAGKVVESKGFKTRKFKPAYVKDKRIIDPRRPLRRQIGETIGGSESITAADREAAAIAQELKDQIDMLNMRFELMAVDAMRDGKTLVDGEGYDAVEVDFGRDAALTETLTAGARWGEADVSPHASLQAKRKAVFAKSGEEITDYVFGVDAFELYVKDPEVKTLLDINLRGGTSEIERIAAIRDGMSFQGRLGAGGPNLWVYSQTYQDDAGVTQDVIDPFEVFGGSTRPRSQGVRYFGAINDPEHGYQATPYAVKSWIERDPAARLIMLQSAPLMVPTRPNSQFRIKAR